ncbi:MULTISPECIES: GntR family transcriptional regulator [unclassified Vibrio]|uniref:GntR family transcriptional regulator n=1 Tax=unclassified Vibrio TaxID=2614977 RepID=UPI0010A698C1|nr:MULTISPECIES: GntR family transcriptional regulator [unclassified Vibrio]WGY47342.1 GntR family transcriptional regulator [Vibrio sp. ABG19]
MANAGIEVISTLRQMIVSGEMAPGERLAEIPTAERLGVSRTPIRIAFRALEQEGLISKLPGRGYRVRQITAESVAGAIAVRGVLEGLAARQAAEKGLSETQLAGLQQCLSIGDAIFSKGYVTRDDLNLYHEINQQFHELILEASDNPAIASSLQRNEHLPFASVSSLTFNFEQMEQEFRRFNFANMQHHTVVDAIVRRQGARAEAIMREHANVTLNYAEVFAEDSRLRK